MHHKHPVNRQIMLAAEFISKRFGKISRKLADYNLILKKKEWSQKQKKRLSRWYHTGHTWSIWIFSVSLHKLCSSSGLCNRKVPGIRGLTLEWEMRHAWQKVSTAQVKISSAISCGLSSVFWIYFRTGNFSFKIKEKAIWSNVHSNITATLTLA